MNLGVIEGKIKHGELLTKAEAEFLWQHAEEMRYQAQRRDGTVSQKRLEREERKSAAANRENERLREEIRRLTHKNYMLQSHLEGDHLQGYIVRYNKLYEALTQVQDILNVKLNGLPDEPPQTIEKIKPPAWAVLIPPTEEKS